MKTGIKTSTLIWIIVTLVIFNVATLVTIYLQKDRSADVVNESSETATPDNSADRFSGRYFRDQLGLTGDQMAEFQHINPGFRQDARSINIALSGLRNRMLNEMSASDADTLKLNAISDSIGVLHSDLKKITFRYYIQLQEICNPEQNVKLQELFREMLGTDGPVGGQNRYGAQGRQRGRQFSN